MLCFVCKFFILTFLKLNRHFCAYVGLGINTDFPIDYDSQILDSIQTLILYNMILIHLSIQHFGYTGLFSLC